MFSDVTNQQRNLALKNASPHQIYLYSNPESGKKLRALAMENGIVEDSSYSKFVLMVGDVIFELMSSPELSKSLTEVLNLQSEKAVKITAEVNNFIKEAQAVNLKNTEKITTLEETKQEENVFISSQNDLLNK